MFACAEHLLRQEGLPQELVVGFVKVRIDWRPLLNEDPRPVLIRVAVDFPPVRPVVAHKTHRFVVFFRELPLDQKAGPLPIAALDNYERVRTRYLLAPPSPLSEALSEVVLLADPLERHESFGRIDMPDRDEALCSRFDLPEALKQSFGRVLKTEQAIDTLNLGIQQVRRRPEPVGA